MPVEHHKAVIELKAYLEDSFGNSVRIDYGSGHEMNFAAFLCCLYKLRVLTDTDSKVVALNIFNRYKHYEYLFAVNPLDSQLRLRFDNSGDDCPIASDPHEIERSLTKVSSLEVQREILV